MDDFTLKEGFLGQRMIVLSERTKKVLATNSITKSFYITNIGYYPKAKYHSRIRRIGVNEYIFIYCIDGEGSLEIEGETINITPNNFFIIPKHVPHSYSSNENNPWSIYWIHFKGTIAENLYERYFLVSRTVFVPFNNDRINLFNKICGFLEKNCTEAQMEFANILGLNLISSFVFNTIYGNSDNLEHENLVNSIIEFLSENLNKTLKTEDIAKAFNYSPSHIFSVFKKRTGYSVFHFFNLKKVQKACELLKFTDLSIKEISFKLGFKDPFYFSRLFKKYMELSPRAYRKMSDNTNYHSK